MNGLEIHGLTKGFGKRNIFHSLSYSFPLSGLVVINGDSGSGKSTLLEILSGIDGDYEGIVRLGRTEISSLNEGERSSFRLNSIGYLRQGYDLLELENALSNVILPLEACSSERAGWIKGRGEDLLGAVGLEGRGKKKSNDFSGGERQRISLARAMAPSPLLFLADEPSSALDEESAKKVFSILKELSKRMLVIVTSHDLDKSKEYGDVVLELKEGKLSEKKKEKKPKSKFQRPLLASTYHWKKDSEVPMAFWLSHAFRSLKSKKKRSAVEITFLAFSLFAVGLSSYFQSGVKEEIEKSFFSLSGPSSLSISPSGALSPISRSIAASENEVTSLLSSYPDFVDYGIFYKASFNSFFPDLDEVYIPNGSSKIVLSSLSIASINSFKWADYEESSFYPGLPPSLEDDEVILGLPYSDMVNVCLSLHILRNYEELGMYIDKHPLPLVFDVANENWTYEDSQIVTLVGVKESKVPCIYHLNHRWNEYMFEEKMRFPTSDEKDDSYPWIMEKIFYLEKKKGSSFPMDKLREEGVSDRYVFDKTPPLGDEIDEDRYYVYVADKNSLRQSEIKLILQESGASSYLVGGEGSYLSYPDALMCGFASPFYLSSSLASLEPFIETVSYLPKEVSIDSIELPPSIVSGSYTKPYGSSLTLSNDFKSLIQGRKPNGITEVCLSSSLFGKLDKPESVFVGGLIRSQEWGKDIERDYRIKELRVVGVVEEEANVIFVTPYWPIDFFREALSMSSFLLEPTSLIIEGKFDKASIAYSNPSLQVKNPSDAIASTSSFILSYAGASLTFSSSILVVISFFLLLSSSLLDVEEGKKEGDLLYLLGISRRGIASNYVSRSLLLVTSSLAIGSMFLLLGELLVHKEIGKAFGTVSSFHISYVPFLWLLGCSIVFFIVLSLIQVLETKSRKFEIR